MRGCVPRSCGLNGIEIGMIDVVSVWLVALMCAMGVCGPDWSAAIQDE
jgi:hypothetical protein